MRQKDVLFSHDCELFRNDSIAYKREIRRELIMDNFIEDDNKPYVKGAEIIDARLMNGAGSDAMKTWVAGLSPCLLVDNSSGWRSFI